MVWVLRASSRVIFCSGWISSPRSVLRATAIHGVEKLFKSLLPDASANDFGPVCRVFRVIAEKIRSELPPPDISGVMDAVEDLLDQSIAAEGYVIRPSAVD